MKYFLLLLSFMFVLPGWSDSRVWRGGEVKQNFQAIATISNADEIPAAALVFVIVYLIGP